MRYWHFDVVERYSDVGFQLKLQFKSSVHSVGHMIPVALLETGGIMNRRNTMSKWILVTINDKSGLIRKSEYAIILIVWG